MADQERLQGRTGQHEMDTLTAQAFGWLSDDHVDRLRDVVSGAQAAGLHPSTASPLTLHEAEKVLTELVAHRVKSKSHGNRLRN